MYLEVLKQEEKFGLRFWSPKNKEKGMSKSFQL